MTKMNKLNDPVASGRDINEKTETLSAKDANYKNKKIDLFILRLLRFSGTTILSFYNFTHDCIAVMTKNLCVSKSQV